MKFSLFILILCCIVSCRNKELPSQYLSNIPVKREAESQRTVSPATETVRTENAGTDYMPAPVQTRPATQTRYHIIVASFSYAEKARAERMISQLKAKNYPATLLSSSNRYRVSIESFTTESEANMARDEYRAVTDRQDIWVHKVVGTN